MQTPSSIPVGVPDNDENFTDVMAIDIGYGYVKAHNTFIDHYNY